MKKNIQKIVVLAFVLLCAACGGSKKGVTMKVENFSNGKAGEVIVIADEPYWETILADTIKASLSQPQPAINQIEPMFDVLHFVKADFSAHFQRHRNIVHFDIDGNYPVNQFLIEKNHWASPQIYVQIKGNDADSCLALYFQHEYEIIESLYENDLRRLQSYFGQNTDAAMQKFIKGKFGIKLNIPEQYFVASEDTDFLWLRYRTVKNDRFIMIYRSPLTDLTAENLIAQRNAITHDYIPGAVKGAYPIVAEKLGFPLADTIAVNGRTGMELRGLWECVNDKMGGPFYSFSYIDEKTSSVITIDGFVYAPEENKRDYLREVEAIVKSAR